MQSNNMDKIFFLSATYFQNLAYTAHIPQRNANGTLGNTMKPSYFQTPRTLEDATFYAWGDPIVKPEMQKQHPADVVIYVLGIVAVVLVFGVLA